jgi:enamine deaminase RidA (YjgF/YER057c/UK114 family)
MFDRKEIMKKSSGRRFMDMRSRREFANSMMAATAAAMNGGIMLGGMMFGGMPLFGQQTTAPNGGPPGQPTTVPAGGPPYVPMGGVQYGPDGVNGNPPPGPIGADSPQQVGAGPGGGRNGRRSRPPRPRPAGIFWISGTGIERQPPGVPWDIKEHARLSMDNIKRGVEARGGSMDSFLYMQVFFCLHLDDAEPMPKGTAAAQAYQQAYQDLNSVYNTYWPNGAPPRSCFALSWIPGRSLFEAVGAAYIDPSVAPPPRVPAG